MKSKKLDWTEEIEEIMSKKWAALIGDETKKYSELSLRYCKINASNSFKSIETHKIRGKLAKF